ncbi:hypothetical protein H696_04876 [Fonticula alba]|uniref:Sds3-like-domain-containing protein n=1 Tax=Fonticula alba TaxID=691883 RepID=A0A058Z2T0_FONAL|nr:hypothetical protein H696_04876 [Fonticula alba]KCV68584.1 hypothetical protein H696_04876 [Fonticula alba]|eukprot:XP_009497016.1 hypothetical protein H696_04876 [Fonticula alba]
MSRSTHNSSINSDATSPDPSDVDSPGSSIDPEDVGGFDSEAENDAAIRRRNVLEHLCLIEKEFFELRDHLFIEKASAIEREIELVSKGTHPDLDDNLDNLLLRRSDKLARALHWYNYRLRKEEIVYQAECRTINADFDNSYKGARDKLLEHLADARRRLDDERLSSFDLGVDPTSESHNRIAPPRKLRRRTGSANMPPNSGSSLTGPASSDASDNKNTKKRVTQGPAIEDRLVDTDARSDADRVLKIIHQSPGGSELISRLGLAIPEPAPVVTPAPTQKSKRSRL